MFLKKHRLKEEEEEERRRRQNNGQDLTRTTTPQRAASRGRSSVVAYYISSSNSQQQQQQHVLSPPRKNHWVNIREGDRPTNLYYYDDSTTNTPRRRNIVSSAAIRKKKKLSLKPATIISAAVMVATAIMGCGFMLAISNEKSSSFRGTSGESNKGAAGREDKSSSWHPRFPQVLHDDDEVHNVELPHYSQHGQAASVTVEVTPGTAYTSKRRRNQGTTTSDGSTLPDQLPHNFITTPTLCPATHTLISQSKILRSSYGTIFSITTPPNPDGSARPTPDQLQTMSVDTITIQTLSLRMADYRPDLGTNFEVWLYTGDQSDLNDNDIDGNPFNNNKVLPSRGEYQQARAKFSDWVLLVTEPEEKLVPDTAFYDHNGHLFNIEPEGDGGTVLGDYKTFDHLEDVTIAAKEWNEGLLRPHGGMDADTQDGEFTKSYFFKIPEELFVPLLLPKFDGKLTLFVTLDRVGMQYGYARKDEFDEIDVSKHDYIDQVKSLDTLNGNVNLQMHVGEGVIMYPWLEEEFFYNTRRFLGKIWYLAQIPCEYSDMYGRFRDTPMPSVHPTGAPSASPSFSPSGNSTIVGPGALCMSTLIKEEKEEPMPPLTIERLETMIEEFVGSALSEYCVRNEQVTVINQTISALPIGDETTTPTAEARSGVGWGKVTSTNVKDQPSESRNLRQLLRSISFILGSGFQQTFPSTRRLQVAISKLEIDLLLQGIVNEGNCPNRNQTEMVEIVVNTIEERNDDFMAEMKNTDEYFAEVFGVSVNNCEEVIAAVAAVIEDDELPIGAIVGGVVAALILCCIICCLPLLIVRRRKHKETELREIIGDDVEWARPVHEDYFPPLGGVRGDMASADGDGDGTGFGARMNKGISGGEFDDITNDYGDIGLKSHAKLRPFGDDSDMEYGHRFLDKDGSPTSKKSRPWGLPGRMPNEGDQDDSKGINIYPGGDIGFEEGDDDELRLRGFEKESTPTEERDDPFSQFNPEPRISQPRGGKWSYEADGGVNLPSRGGDHKTSAKPSWKRLPAKGPVMAKSMRNLSINPQVLARIQSVKQRMKDLRAVEKEGVASPKEDGAQIFPPRESDDRIAQLMNRIKNLEKARNEKYQRRSRGEGESDYEKWRRLQLGDGELSSSEDSSDEDVNLDAARRRKKKKKKNGKDYILNFEDLDAYNRALAVHEDAYIHKWVRVKVEKVKKDQNTAAAKGTNALELDVDEDGEGFLDLGDLGGDDDTVDGRSLGGSVGGTIVLGDLNDDTDDDTGSYLGSIGGDDESTMDLGTIGDDTSVASSVASVSSRSSKSSLASRASSFISRLSRKRSKKSKKSLDSLGPEEYENEINTQRATKLSKIVRDRSLSKDEKMRRMKEVNQWYAAALQRVPKRTDEEYLGDLNEEDDDDDNDDTMNLGSIGGGDSTVDLGTIGDESELSSLASKSTMSRASLVSRMSKVSKKSLDSLDPEEYENEINAQRAAKLSKIVRDKSISKDEKARRTDEVNKWYSAALLRPKRKGIGERQQTEYLGDLDFGDESSDDDEPDSKPPPKRPGLGARQATEYIGDVPDDDEDSDDESDAPKKPRPKRGLGARQATEYIGDLDDDSDDDEFDDIGDLGDDSDDDESNDEPTASKPPPKRGLGARQATEYIGDLGDNYDDDESNDEPTASKSKPPVRRGLGARQATEFIGDLGDDYDDDESNDEPTASKPPPKRGLGARQATKFIKFSPDESDDESDTPKKPPSKRGLGDRQATEYIGDLGDDSDDDESNDEPTASKPPPKRGLGARQATEFIGDLGDNYDDDEFDDIGDLGDDSDDDDSNDEPTASKPPPKRGLGARQATKFIKFSPDESDDESDTPKKPPSKRGLGDRQATEYIGDLGDDSDDDDSNDEPTASKPPPKRGLGARQATKFIKFSPDNSDDESDTPKKPPSKRGLGDRQATEYIGDLGDDSDDDEPIANKPPSTSKRGLGSRQATEYIGDLGDDSEDSDDNDKSGVAPSTSRQKQLPGRFAGSGPSSAQDPPQKRASTVVRFAEPKLDEDSPEKHAPLRSALKKPSALRSSMAASQQSVMQTEEKPKPAEVLTEKELSAQRSAKLSTIMRDRSLDRDERKRRIDEVKQWYAGELAALSGSSADQSTPKAGVASSAPFSQPPPPPADQSTPKAGVASSAPFSQPSPPPAAQDKAAAKPHVQSMLIEYINTLDSLEDLKEDLEEMPMPALQRLASQLNIEQPRDKPRPRLEQMIAESIQSIHKF